MERFGASKYMRRIKENVIIHCKTREEASLCSKLFFNCGLAELAWQCYGEDTCIHFYKDGSCSYNKINFYLKEHYKITEFKDFVKGTIFENG